MTSRGRGALDGKIAGADGGGLLVLHRSEHGLEELTVSWYVPTSERREGLPPVGPVRP